MTKKIVISIGLATLFASITLKAQVPSHSGQVFRVSDLLPLAAESASNSTVVLDVRSQKTVAVQITASSDTDGGQIGLCFVPSVDGTTAGSTTLPGSAVKMVSFTPGQTPTTVLTNLDSFGCGYLKLAYVTNSTGGALTNLTLKATYKASVF